MINFLLELMAVIICTFGCAYLIALIIISKGKGSQ